MSWSTAWEDAAPAPPSRRRVALPRPTGPSLRLQAGLVGLAATAAISGMATFSAFTGDTHNLDNTVSSGTVTLEDNDGDEAMFTLSGARPGDAAEGCILVTYTGSLDGRVRLTGTTTGAGAPYVTLTVTRGSGTAAGFPSCAAFAADPTDHIGAGPGVIYEGALADFPASFGDGVLDPDVWQSDDAHAYRFEVTVDDVDPALLQGLSTTAAFTWHSRWAGP